MIDFLLSLPTWVGCGIAMACTAFLGLAVYIVSYNLIAKYNSVELKDSINSLFRVVGLFVSLLLSLAFGQVLAEWQAIKHAIDREAVAISDTHRNLEYFDKEGTRKIRSVLIDYTHAVIEDDWPAMANNQLGRRTSELIGQFTVMVMGLIPTNQLQKDLRAHIIADLDDISDYRLIRLNRSLSKPPVYVVVIIFGFLVSMACFGANRPQIPLLALVSLYSVFVGMVLYLIVAMSDPFHGGTYVDPSPFEYLLETLQP